MSFLSEDGLPTSDSISARVECKGIMPRQPRADTDDPRNTRIKIERRSFSIDSKKHPTVRLSGSPTQLRIQATYWRVRPKRWLGAGLKIGRASCRERDRVSVLAVL